LTFHLLRHGSRLRVDVDPGGVTLTVLSGSGIPIRDGEATVLVTVDEPHRIPRTPNA
jgi:hypothetical protein